MFALGGSAPLLHINDFQNCVANADMIMHLYINIYVTQTFKAIEIEEGIDWESPTDPLYLSTLNERKSLVLKLRQ